MDITRRTLVGAAGAIAIERATGVARAETAMTNELPFAANAPVSVSHVGIKAKDIETIAAYYRKRSGCRSVARASVQSCSAPANGRCLRSSSSHRRVPDDPKSAGLYHTAFLLPTRPDLARWARRAIDMQIPVVGASDHSVSEAIYLTDPEGNGIEIYADRPKANWGWDGDRIKMGTEPLDVGNLLGELQPGDAGWQGAPDNSIVGHVHLRVGDTAEAEKFWNNELGFDTVAQYGKQAVFLSTGGYHHHVGANSWQSLGAKERDSDRTGLSYVVFNSKSATEEKVVEDPWGNVIRVVPA